MHGEVNAIPELSKDEIDYFHLLKMYCANFNRIASLVRDKDPSLVDEIKLLVSKLTLLQKRII